MMNRKLLKYTVGVAMFASVATVALTSIAGSAEVSAGTDAALNTEVSITNKWSGDFGGIPPLDKVKVSDFKPAIEMAMAEKLAEIEKIANNPEPATFENTIAALERSGQMYDRVMTMFGIWSSTMNDEEFQKVDTEMAPKLSEFDDKIVQNEKLFKRIEQVYNTRESGKLTPEQQRLVWSDYTYFVSAGAKLSGEAKEKMSKINQELASLFTKFGQNLLADESNGMVEIKSEADLAGLSASMKNGYANAAKDRKLEGSWVVSNTRSSVEPFLTYSENRAMREKVWQMFVNRGDNGDEHDNNKIITQILKLRKERAQLLGFKNHAEWRLQNSMAKTPEKAMELMESVWPAAIARVKEEVADMQAMADKEGAKIKIEPWDYRFYAEKVRKAKYDLDQNEVKEYLQLEKLREGMFWVAGELFNFSFTPLNNIPVYHADVKVWEVKDKTSGKHIGLWYFDPYARKGKRSGAWMNAYRNQQRMDGNITTIVSNNSNFIKGSANEPVLISWDDASTLFHEFGHALHGLASNVTYPTLSGTNVVRDYVEFPSQLLEHWLSTPEVLNKFAIHYKTGVPIPKTLVERIEKASTFNEGFATTEFLSSALVDMKLHTSDQDNIDPDKFEKDMLKQLNMPSEIVMRHRTPQFAHIFSSDSYSAGYYSYLWADVLTADAYSAFTDAGGPYDKAVAASLIKNIFSVGNTIDPETGFKTFRGRNADTKALMKKRGFPVK
ncbi:MAG: M3 family metallopeptidase [Bacteroidota bacterium]